MKYTCMLLFLLLFLSEDIARSQEFYPPPRVYLVSVDIETQFDSIVWYSLPLQPDDYYYVGEYSYIPGNPDGYTFKISPGIKDTFYLNNNQFTVSEGKPIAYDVWGVLVQADGSTHAGKFSSPPDSTMFLESVFDSCAGTITLNWNDYNTWRGSTTSFTVYRRISAGVYLPLDNVAANPNITHYTHVLGNVLPNETYDLFVQAAHVDGIRRSNSTRAAVDTKWTVQTGTINADFATISAANTIDLSFTTRGALGEDKYRLLKSNQPGGVYVAIDSISTSDTIIHFNDDTPFTSGIYYYKLEMINNCGTMFTESNLANNIILSGTQSGSIVDLSWNIYTDWLGGVERYSVIRTLGRTNPQVDTLNANTPTTHSDNVAALIDYSNPSSSMICYQIDALEGSNNLGIR